MEDEVVGMAVLQVDGLRIPFEVRTLEGFRRWVSGLDTTAPRVSFVDGDVWVAMTPQNYRTHAPIVTAINKRLMDIVEETGRGMYFLSPSWFTCKKARVSTEPDGFFASYDTLKSGALKLNSKREHELLGSPDFVLEVVSPSAPEKDLVRLRKGYARAGIPEYWLVDALGPRLDFKTLVLRDGAYVEVPVRRGGWRTSPFWERAFRLRPLTNPAGMTEYRLDVREV